MRVLLRISRPRFWLYLGGTYLVGFTAGTGRLADFGTPGFWAYLIYFLVPANLFLYGINDLFDEDTDRHNPKKGLQEHRLLSSEKRTLAVAVATCAALGAALAVVFVPDSMTWAARATMLGFLALGAGYSLPPLRFKARPFLDFPSNVLYALPGVLGYLLVADKAPPVVAVVGAFAWTGAMHLFSAVPDIEADRAAELATTATELGARASLALCAALWLVAAWVAVTRIGAPLGWLACLYPLSAALLVARPAAVARAYWFFPLANAAAGFALFMAAVP